MTAGESNTAALYTGGENPTPTVLKTNELWNGSAWTESADMNIIRRNGGGSGTKTDALVFAGDSPPLNPPTTNVRTEAWNGSAWYEVNDMNNESRAMGTMGPQTSLLAFGGENPDFAYMIQTESWDGTIWTNVNNMNISAQQRRGSGSASSGFAAGGSTSGGFTAATEEWNADVSVGAWVTANSLNTGRRDGAASGTQTAALYFAGTSPGTSKHDETELYNGTSFSEVNDLNTARDGTASATKGTTTSSLCFGGDNGPERNETETWNGAVWTEVNNLNTARKVLMGNGIQTSALAYGGISPTAVVAITESWNGSSWTEVADLNTATDLAGCVGADNTSALAFGGRVPPSYTTTNKVESWNGSSWTEVNDLPIAIHNNAGSGIITAALSVGGGSSPTSVQTWNGSSWAAANSINTGRSLAKSAGTSTATVTIGGEAPFSGAGTTEEWYAEGIVTEKISSS